MLESRPQQLVLEAELVPCAQRGLGLAAGQGLLENGPIQRPGPVRVGVGERGGLGQSVTPRWRNLPSSAAKPPQISRRPLRIGELAEQHRDELLPAGEARAWRSARCVRTSASNSRRGKNCNSWLKMLDTLFMAGWLLGGRTRFWPKPEPTYQTGRPPSRYTSRWWLNANLHRSGPAPTPREQGLEGLAHLRVDPQRELVFVLFGERPPHAVLGYADAQC